MHRVPRAADEHLLRSVDELFFSLPSEPAYCRLCGGSFQANRWAGHLDYHRELFEEHRRTRALIDRRVKAAEERLALRLDADAWVTPNLRQLARHEKLYGRVPRALAGAMGVEEENAPKVPASVARRMRRRAKAASGGPRLGVAV